MGIVVHLITLLIPCCKDNSGAIAILIRNKD